MERSGGQGAQPIAKKDSKITETLKELLGWVFSAIFKAIALVLSLMFLRVCAEDSASVVQH